MQKKQWQRPESGHPGHPGITSDPLLINHLSLFFIVLYLWMSAFYFIANHVDDENTHADHLIWKCLFNFTL